MISGSSIHDIEFVVSAPSDVSNPCFSVFWSLYSDISFYFLGYTRSAFIAGLRPGPAFLGSLALCNPVYTLGSAAISGLFLGPSVTGYLASCNPIYVFGLDAIASLGLSSIIPWCLALCNPAYVHDSAVIAGFCPGFLAPGFLPFSGPIYALVHKLSPLPSLI